VRFNQLTDSLAMVRQRVRKLTESSQIIRLQHASGYSLAS